MSLNWCQKLQHRVFGGFKEVFLRRDGAASDEMFRAKLRARHASGERAMPLSSEARQRGARYRYEYQTCELIKK